MSAAGRRGLLRAALFAAAALAAAAPAAFARAGGGSSGGGGGGILTAILLPFILAYTWYVNKRIRDKNAAAEAMLAKLAARDPEWSEQRLLVLVRQKFFLIEKLWCDQNLPELKDLLAPGLYQDWSRQIEDLHGRGRRNVLDALRLDEARVVEVQNYRDENRDVFTVCIDAHASDYTVDGQGRIVEVNSSDSNKRNGGRPSFEAFREFWTFHRRGKADWLLERVDQSGDWKRSVGEPLVDEDSGS